jgi:hypothetical protein
LGQINEAENAYQSVLALLGADRVALATMPKGRPLMGDLSEVVQLSEDADTAYAGWLRDLEATGCYSAPRNDLHYEEAEKLADASQSMARVLASTWGGLALQYRLRVWAASQL